MSWELKKLDDLGTVNRGRSRHRPRDADHLYGGPYPFIQTGDVKHAELYINSYSQTYSEAGLAQSKLWPKGTLCITIAANIADTSILDMEACFPDSIIGFIADEEKANSLFIKYLFDAVLQRRYKKFSHGATQDNLSQSKLLSIDFPIPPLPIQNRIASILSAYDELIQNNKRRIELLEKSAQLLYKEWFVHLRFPGHEHTKNVDGVPEGWERVKIEKLFKNHIGGGWGKEEPEDNESEPAFVIRGTDISDIYSGSFQSVGLRYHKESALQSRLLEKSDIIFEVSGGSVNQPVGRSLRISSEILDVFNGAVICASFCKRFTPVSDEISHYLQRLFIEERDNGKLQVFQKQSASAIQNFNFQAFLDHKEVLVPKKVLLEEFVSSIANIEDQKFKLSKICFQLKRARDLLLPKLMNGELPV